MKMLISGFQRERTRWGGIIVLVTLCLRLAGCSGGDDVSAPLPSPANGTLTGRVIASDGSGGVPNAVIEVGTVQTTSGADGSYSVSLPANDRAVVRVGANGFAENIRIARVVGGQSTPLTVRLVKVGVTQTIVTTSGGTITAPNSPAQVVIPGDALIPLDGGPPAANVQFGITPINVAATTNNMPGDYTASTGGNIVTIVSSGAMRISARDSNNVQYGLAPGTTATIRIPVSTRSASVSATIPLFYFDDSSGRWIEEGQATLAGTGANRYYEGTVSRLSYWNADLVTETILVNGCVKTQAGQAVGNALVESDGIDYSGSSQVYTGADGSFLLPIQKNGKATVAALVGTQLTNTVSIGPSATDIALDSCLVTGSRDGFNIKLTWGASPSDLDSHLYTPNGDHVYFGDKGALTGLPFVNLDVDDTTSFGPEVATLTKVMQGTYVYAVHNFSGTQSPGITGSPTRVELTRDGNTTVFAPTTGEGTEVWWHVFNIEVDAQCNVSVTPVNAWLVQAPSPLPGGTPTVCNVN